MNEKVKQMLEEYKESYQNLMNTQEKIRKRQKDYESEMHELQEESRKEGDIIRRLEYQPISVSLRDVLEEIKNHSFVQKLGEMQVSDVVRCRFARNNKGQITLLEDQLDKIKKSYLLSEVFSCTLRIDFPAANKTISIGFDSGASKIQKDGKSLAEHIKIKPIENSKEYGGYCLDDYSQIMLEKSFGQVYGGDRFLMHRILRDCVQAVLEKEPANSDEPVTTEDVMGD